MSSPAVNSKCPVSDHDVEAGFTAVVDGKTIGFCCEKCPAEFQKDPKKFVALIPELNPKKPEVASANEMSQTRFVPLIAVPSTLPTATMRRATTMETTPALIRTRPPSSGPRMLLGFSTGGCICDSTMTT